MGMFDEIRIAPEFFKKDLSAAQFKILKDNNINTYQTKGFDCFLELYEIFNNRLYKDGEQINRTLDLFVYNRFKVADLVYWIEFKLCIFRGKVMGVDAREFSKQASKDIKLEIKRNKEDLRRWKNHKKTFKYQFWNKVYNLSSKLNGYALGKRGAPRVLRDKNNK